MPACMKTAYIAEVQRLPYKMRKRELSTRVRFKHSSMVLCIALPGTDCRSGRASPLGLHISVGDAEAPEAVELGALRLPLHVLPLLAAQALARRQDLLIHHLQRQSF